MTSVETFESARLRSARFRANPDYSLVPFDRLDGSERGSLEELRPDPEFYGVMKPVEGSRGNVKRVDPHTALLLLTLDDPGGLPSYVLARLGEDLRPVAQLLLEGLLEIERNGIFVSGPESLDGLRSGTKLSRPIRSFLAALSERAVRLAQDLPTSDAQKIAARLYMYHRLPATSRWRDELGNDEGVEKALGLDRNSVRHLLNRHWQRIDTPPPNDHWLAWSAAPARAQRPTQGPTYKLYVSPHPDDLGEVFERTVEILTEQNVQSFKIGRDTGGLLRPDKFVAYFWDRAQLFETGERTAAALSGFRAHGVPFTAALDDRGMVSWGVDPDRPEFQVRWLSDESWRLRVTRRLATALVDCRDAPSGAMEPWEFALERVRLEGIDVDTWTPEEAKNQ